MAAESSLRDLAGEARLPRNLILADREGAPAEDLRDCAAQLIKSGSIAAAELLSDAATLSVGSPPNESTERRGSTWDVAVDELSDLISVGEEETQASPGQETMRLALGETDDKQAPTPPPDGTWMASEFAPTLRALLAVRAQTSTPSTAEPNVLVEMASRSRPFDLTTLRREPVELATALAFNVVRRVLIERGELARAPFGGSALFQRGERLAAGGLGLGFRNLSFVAPTLSDIEFLITEAWRKASHRHDLASTIDRFAVLLSIGLPGERQRAMVDTLADRGQPQILIGILIRLQRTAVDRVDPDLLRRLRDAFLDLGRLRLAAAAQRRLTVAMGAHPAEMAAQDELEASWRHQSDLLAGASPARPARKVVRRSGFGSTALQRQRRFRHAAEGQTEDWKPPTSW